MKTKLQEFLEIEKQEQFYDITIQHIPIWHYYRYFYRYKYVSTQTGVKGKSNTLTWGLLLKNCCKNVFRSICDVTKLYVSGKKVKNVVFAFPRLQCRDGVYFDKITDPAIDASSLSDSVCIMQFSFRNHFGNNRRNASKVCNIEVLFVLAYLLLPLYALYRLFSLDFYKINKVYNKARRYVPLNWRDLVSFHASYLSFRVLSFFMKRILTRLKVERLFGVDRKVFEMATISAHQLGIPVYEFQHGVTFGDTALYSGPDCYQLDPDYFLSFGEIWNGNQFGISPDRIINIGWAYKDEVLKHISQAVKPKSVMVVSSPEITFKILQTVEELAATYPDYQFDIRCHPMEKYTDEQLSVVDSYSNVSIADTSIDSNIAIGQYEYVLGENSSVVFEALSFGKKVGRICYNDIKSKRLGDIVDDGFYYLNSKEDFLSFVSNTQSQTAGRAYSDFMPDVVDGLPKKQYI